MFHRARFVSDHELPQESARPAEPLDGPADWPETLHDIGVALAALLSVAVLASALLGIAGL